MRPRPGRCHVAMAAGLRRDDAARAVVEVVACLWDACPWNRLMSAGRARAVGLRISP